MRTSKYGSKLNLNGEITDIIGESLPSSDKVDSFLNSKDMNKMVDSIITTIEEHIEENINIARILE